MAKAKEQHDSLDIDLVRASLEPDYAVLEEIGRGGMAMVYRAKERALERDVAIKVLPSFMAMDTAFVERFQHEARTAGNLEHPNIVPIYRVGSEGRVIYFVMKLLRGQSLASVLRQRPKLRVPEVRRILLETASALGYAAKRGVVHRDIKPDNILLDDEGRCVLTDFGIAKSSGGPLTAAGTSMGTPSYMSPEHARGAPLDGRSDIYSLGVVAYECLTGTIPFEASDPFAILYKHINDPLPRPELNTDEERALYVIIEKMLAKNPEDRFQTADDLIGALGGARPSSAQTLVSAVASGLAGTGPLRVSGMSATEIIVTPTFGTRIRDLSRDRRAWVGAGGVLALVLVMIASSGDDAPVTTQSGAVGATTRTAAGATGAAADALARPPGAVTGGGGAGTTTAAATPPRPQGGGTVATSSESRTGATTGSKAPVSADTGGSRSTKLRSLASAPTASSRAAPTRSPASTCPRSITAGSMSVLVDSLRNQQQAGSLTVNYDVCGLAQGTPFTATFKFRKLNQGRFRRQQDRVLSYPEVAASTRSRKQRVVQLAGLSAGRYALDVLVRDPNGRENGTTREFQIVER